MTNTQRQHLLAYLGYYVMDITDKWTEECRVACRAFQEDFQGIQVDGLGGPETDKALKHSVCYGMPDQKVEEVVEEKTEGTGTFWDEIEYFTRDEFRCKCGGKYCNGYPAEPDERMVRIADAIRKRIGKPITVNSGLRCKTHNANAGGVSNSQHLYGTAADLGCPSGCTPSQMASIAEEIMGETGGIGIYSWGIHIDTRSTKSRWNG